MSGLRDNEVLTNKLHKIIVNLSAESFSFHPTTEQIFPEDFTAHDMFMHLSCGDLPIEFGHSLHWILV